MKTDGSVEDFSPEDLAAAEKAITAMASTGLRTLCIAYVDLDTDPSGLSDEPPEANLTLLGITGIKDPIRPETAEAVRLLRQAGVIVRMVTGDNKLTAEAIARRGWNSRGWRRRPRPRRPRVPQDEPEASKEAVAVKIRVLARSSPR